MQDDSFSVRVVVGEPLADDEQAMWVDHWTARFAVSGDTLTISGGMEYLWGEEMDEYTEHISVPSGTYRADFYTYIPSVNGWYCLASVPGDDEPSGAYFRRTRPGEEFPDWLKGDCTEDPEIDPGHEDEWAEEDFEEDKNAPAYCDFLLHLTPVSESEFAALPVAPINPPNPDRPEGWIEIAIHPRKPDKFPTGLVSPDDTE